MTGAVTGARAAQRAWPPPSRAWPWSLRASIGLHAVAGAAALGLPGAWPWSLGAVAANHLLLGGAALWPQCGLLGPNMVRLPQAAAARNEVALTFDDGPDPAVTPRVLDLLEAHGARASFFCVGRRAAAHPQLVRDIVRRGHSVENHTHTHPHAFACYPPHALRRQIARAQAVLEDAAGRAPRFFRAPAGVRSPLLDPVLAGTGLALASWTRRGFDTVEGDPHRVTLRLTAGMRPGDIVLLHDGRCARTRGGLPVVLAVLPDLLACLAALGLRPVSLPMAVASPQEARAGQDAGLLWDRAVSS